MRRKTYTSYECDEIYNKKTKKTYKIGQCCFLNGDEFVSNLIHPWDVDYQFIKKASPPIIQKHFFLVGKKRTVYQRIYTMDQSAFLFSLKYGNQPTGLYTLHDVDVVREIKTMREYDVDKNMIVMDNVLRSIKPEQIVENYPYQYEFIFNSITADVSSNKNQKMSFDTNDYLKEIWVANVMRNTLKKK